MITRIAVACLALYGVHSAQTGAPEARRSVAEGAAMALEAGTQAPHSALKLCLDHAALCARAGEQLAAVAAPSRTSEAKTAEPRAAVAVDYPLPPRRPAPHKKA